MPDQRVGVVTGAGQGIGRVIARRLGDSGMGVVIADREVSTGQATAAELRAEGIEASFIEADVTDIASCRSLADEVVSAFGGIDVLVNNAAIASTVQRAVFWELDDDEWDSLMAVNLRGVWNMTRACQPALVASKAGAVVNMASGVAIVAPPNYAHYVASKAGVVGLTRAMARELGPLGVRVNAVSPGPVPTGGERTGFNESDLDGFIQQQCLKRAAEPIDVAHAINFLASCDASFITGQTLVVDGGMMFH